MSIELIFIRGWLTQGERERERIFSLNRVLRLTRSIHRAPFVCCNLLDILHSSFASQSRWHEKYPCFVSLAFSIYFDDYRCHVHNIHIFRIFCCCCCAFSVRYFFFTSSLPHLFLSSVVIPSLIHGCYRSLSFLWTEQLLLGETLFNNYTRILSGMLAQQRKKRSSIYPVFNFFLLLIFSLSFMLINFISHNGIAKTPAWKWWWWW